MLNEVRAHAFLPLSGEFLMRRSRDSIGLRGRSKGKTHGGVTGTPLRDDMYSSHSRIESVRTTSTTPAGKRKIENHGKWLFSFISWRLPIKVVPQESLSDIIVTYPRFQDRVGRTELHKTLVRSLKMNLHQEVSLKDDNPGYEGKSGIKIRLHLNPRCSNNL